MEWQSEGLLGRVECGDGKVLEVVKRSLCREESLPGSPDVRFRESIDQRSIEYFPVG